jgi:pimeloyl-ACP methyl ester carboxylesterase
MPTFSRNGVTLNYRVEGAGDDDVVFVHNMTANIECLSQNTSHVSNYFRTIAADLRGHGQTSREDSVERAPEYYTFEKMADDNLALLDELGVDRYFLFGQAYWGLNTALHMYAKQPERVRGIVVASAYMISTDPGVSSGDTLDDDERKNFERMNQLALEKGMTAVYEERIQSGQFWSEIVRSNEEILAAFRKALTQMSPAAFVTMPALRHSKRAEIAEVLRRRRTPLLLVLGEQDRHNDTFMAEMKRDYPETDVSIIPAAGHYPTIENPRAFNRILLDFIAGVKLFDEAKRGIDSAAAGR